MIKTIHHDVPFQLESGKVLSRLDIAYHTFGQLNNEHDNVVWVCHALTANSDVDDWWRDTVKAGSFLDPEKYFVICANVLGSCYGTTGPLSINPATGEPYYHDFPEFTVRDIVGVHQILAERLGIRRVKMLIGSSLGGFQCMEWALIQPDFAESVVLIATSPETKPWAAAFNESQRMAIEADATFRERSPEAGLAGMGVARSLALLSYRGPDAYNLTQADHNDNAPKSPFVRHVHSYQRHQGKKLTERFNAYSYYRLSQAVDSHNVARNRGTMSETLGAFKPRTMIVAITSDILFPPSDHQDLVNFIPDSEYHLIDSEFGHDGFLIEHKKLNSLILNFLNKQ